MSKLDDLDPFEQMTAIKDQWRVMYERSEAGRKILAERIAQVIQHEDLPDGVRMALESGLEQSLKAARVDAGPSKLCAVCDTPFEGSGRLCGANHSRAQVREAFGADQDGDV